MAGQADVFQPSHLAQDERIATQSTSTTVLSPSRNSTESRTLSLRQLIYDRLGYVAHRCRYYPERPFEFSRGLNLLFGKTSKAVLLQKFTLTKCGAFAACFTVANLYYTHPILNRLAHDFGVTDEQSSYIAFLSQLGYAVGLLFLCPLADLVKRRPFVLWLVWFTATLWYAEHVHRKNTARPLTDRN